jgi:tetratricopeptide (TPR) repeat protein/DNA-binding CsgD family transcriptional regulator
MKKLLYLFIISSILLCACRHTDNTTLLRQADAVIYGNSDSAMKLLSSIKNPERLPFEEKMLYGWLRTFAHNVRGASMAEDSLILPAFNYFVAGSDTVKMLNSYVLKSQYLYWQKKHEEAMTVLDSGIAAATACRDTYLIVHMLSLKASKHVYVEKNYEKAIEAHLRAIAVREDEGLCFSLGIAMGLQGNDSASYYMDRSIELVGQKKDTVRLVHYLRNYAQMLSYISNDYEKAVAVSKRLRSLASDGGQIAMTDLVLTECFLKMGKLDSAQYYLDQGRALLASREKFLTTENMINYYQGLIDYTRHRTFDFLKVMRYNDSVHNALYALQSTIQRKDESKESLSNANLMLTVERQEAQLTLLGCLLLLVVVGGGAFFYIWGRRHRLIEAEERIETLNRLLADATKGDGEQGVAGNTDKEVEDGQFFRKILLQQLGIIRLVATQPTSQNQELLRRISGITNRELPVESLLVWEDLYPVIDRIYDGFYTQMNRRFGSVLIDKEQQLCCLLCAEFSTKEISVVTQQSIPTIYQRKTNIRKKLGMGEKEDIVGFILEK